MSGKRTMTPQEIKDFMHSKGFSEWSRTGDGNIITYCWDRGLETNTSFACDINIKKQSFEFRYVCGMTQLCQGPMTPICYAEHFSKMANHFYARVEALAKAFPRE